MVDSIRLFDLATQQANWLSVRQMTVAGNIANANTPGYQTQDVKPFSEVLNTASPMAMRVTNPKHMLAYADADMVQALQEKDTSETTHTGNNVSIEDEMRKGSEVSREMSMNTVIVKAFHQMLLRTVRGS